MEIGESTHGNDRVGEDHREVGDVGGDVVEEHRVRVAQLDPRPPGKPARYLLLSGHQRVLPLGH